MNEQIEKILEQEEQRIKEEDRTHGIHGYVTCPSGLRDIRLDTMRGLPVKELIVLAEKSKHGDLDILKVAFDAYVSIARGYLAQRK